MLVRKAGVSIDAPACYIRIYYYARLLELVPALDRDVAGGEAAEGVDERFGKASIGEQGDVEVYSGTADLVSVGELTGSEVLGQVHYHVNLLAVEHVKCLRLHAFFAGPVYEGVLNAVLGEVA